MGLLSAKDKKGRKTSATRAVKEYEVTFWTNDIALYLDTVSFVRKYNLFKQASYPKGRVYRGWVKVCTTQQRGRKLLLMVEQFMLLLPFHTLEVLYLQRSMRKWRGRFFAEFITRTVPNVFTDTLVQSGRVRATKMILLDNDPCQTIIKIPTRSPYLNPIENIFNNVQREVEKQASNRRIHRI